MKKENMKSKNWKKRLRCFFKRLSLIVAAIVVLIIVLIGAVVLYVLFGQLFLIVSSIALPVFLIVILYYKAHKQQLSFFNCLKHYGKQLIDKSQIMLFYVAIFLAFTIITFLARQQLLVASVGIIISLFSLENMLLIFEKGKATKRMIVSNNGKKLEAWVRLSGNMLTLTAVFFAMIPSQVSYWILNNVAPDNIPCVIRRLYTDTLVMVIAFMISAFAHIPLRKLYDSKKSKWFKHRGRFK